MKNTKQPIKIKRIPVTREGFEVLKKELLELQNQRPQAVKNLSEARSMGDLSENGLYTAAKAKLRSIDSQIFRLDIQIKLADIIEISETGKVSLNSKVIIENENLKRELHIVGDYEADPVLNKISQNSPLGKALMGKRMGEIFEFHAPKGIIKFKITSVK
jgi:transcription elongation factor GreA